MAQLCRILLRFNENKFSLLLPFALQRSLTLVLKFGDPPYWIPESLSSFPRNFVKFEDFPSRRNLEEPMGCRPVNRRQFPISPILRVVIGGLQKLFLYNFGSKLKVRNFDILLCPPEPTR